LPEVKKFAKVLRIIRKYCNEEKSRRYQAAIFEIGTAIDSQKHKQ